MGLSTGIKHKSVLWRNEPVGFSLHISVFLSLLQLLYCYAVTFSFQSQFKLIVGKLGIGVMSLFLEYLNVNQTSYTTIVVVILFFTWTFRKELNFSTSVTSFAASSLQLTGPIQVLHQARARVDSKGGKNELTVKQGDQIEIIRLTDNPEGKWLGRIKGCCKFCSFTVFLNVFTIIQWTCVCMQCYSRVALTRLSHLPPKQIITTTNPAVRSWHTGLSS